MVNRRQPIAAEYVARGVVVLPNVSADFRFRELQTGLFSADIARVTASFPCRWEKRASAVAQSEICP
jgi:hypothetical protein